MIKCKEIILALTCSVLPFETPAWAKRASSAKLEKSQARKKRPPSLHEKFVELKRRYRMGEISDKTMWVRLAGLYRLGNKLSERDRVSLLQAQSHLLLDAGYPILSTIYAAQAIKISKNAGSRGLKTSWSILQKVSEHRPIQNLLEVVADYVDFPRNGAPVFATDWYYHEGNAAVRDGKTKAALEYYAKLKLNDRYFLPAKYQQAILHVEENNLDKAIVALKAILHPSSQRQSPLDQKAREKIADYAYLALGRIYYEKENFLGSAAAYRKVDKNGLNFYDALFEQSWAFFMGGYPMHALGALHAAESPFYDQVFNPEAPILRALIYYWLCRYDDSRIALADFMDRYGSGVESLNEFLDRKMMNEETAYQLFENLVSDVSEASLGVSKSILQTAAEKDSMMLVRDQYASIIEERARLSARGVFGTSKGVDKPMEYMDRWAGALRKDIGRKFLSELKALKSDYERMYDQAQFLYVELLMSEKEQLLGKELHASSKMTRVNKRMKLSGWGEQIQSWKGSRKGEYWWDEMGWYITPIEPKCAVR